MDEPRAHRRRRAVRELLHRRLHRARRPDRRRARVHGHPVRIAAWRSPPEGRVRSGARLANLPGVAPSRSSSRFVRLARVCNRHRWRTFGVWLLALVVVQVVAVERRRQADLELPPAGNREPARLRPAGRALPGRQGRHRPARLQGAHAARSKDPANKARDRRRAQEGRRRRHRSPASQSPFSRGRPADQGRPHRRRQRSPTRRARTTSSPTTLEKVQNAAFTARSPQLQVEHGGPGRRGRALHQQPGPVGVRRHHRRRDRPAHHLRLAGGRRAAADRDAAGAGHDARASSRCSATSSTRRTSRPSSRRSSAWASASTTRCSWSRATAPRSAAACDRDEAVEKAIDTAGRTVMFAAITVVIALLGLLLLGLSFMHGVALGAATAVLADDARGADDHPGADRRLGQLHRRRAASSSTSAAASASGARSAASASRARPGGRAAPARRERQRAEGRGLGALVARRPAPPVARRSASRSRSSSASRSRRRTCAWARATPASTRPGTTTRKAYDLIADGFGAGTNGSFLLVAELAPEGRQGRGAADRRRRARPTRTSPSSRRPRCRPTGRWPPSPPTRAPARRTQATTDTLKRLRDDVVPAVEREHRRARSRSAASPPPTRTSRAWWPSKLPLFVGVVVLFSALLLLVVFRSVIIPIKAAILNLLSIGAALGFVTLDLPGGPRGRACWGSAPGRSSPSCRC